MKLLFLFFCVLCVASNSNAAEIRDIRMGQHDKTTRLTIGLSGLVGFQATVATTPQRLDVVLPVSAFDGLETISIPTPFHSLNQRPFNSNLHRLSIAMDKPHIIQSAFLIAEREGDTHRLIIDMAPASQDEFAQALSVKHGPLQISPMTTLPDKTKGKKIIIIDPGHGGRDPGAISPHGIREKDITLSMAKTIAEILNHSGRYRVQLTRIDDRFIRLYDRVRIAREAGADVFLSIHADSVSGDNSVRGASVYTLSNTASDTQTAELAIRENRADLIGGFDLDIQDDDAGAILIDLSLRETLTQSKSLASHIIRGLRQGDITTLRGPHRYAGFAVLRAPDVPSVLLETGFISNEAEAQTLLERPYQEKIAKAIKASLDAFFAH